MNLIKISHKNSCWREDCTHHKNFKCQLSQSECDECFQEGRTNFEERGGD